MSNDQGWISLHRKITENRLWHKKPFSWGHAWVDLLILANYQDKKMIFDSGIIEVKRGQLITSFRTLCTRWGWSNTKLKQFLFVLELEEMCTRKSDTKKTLLTIVNYHFYQSAPLSETTQKTTLKRHRNDTETTLKRRNNNINNINNENNVNNNITIVQLKDSINIPFDDFWNTYDKKVGNKEKLRRRWATLSDSDRQAAMDYIPNYINSQPDKKFRKNPETFLNNKSWNDELIFSNHEPKQKSGTSRISRSFVEEVYSGLPPELYPG